MFTVSIVTQEKVLFEEEVSSVIAPGSEGYLGILTNHAPLITALIPGKLNVKDADGKEFIFAISGGFLEVSNNVATILADSVETTAEIELSRAEAALLRAKQRLEQGPIGIDMERAAKAKLRAENRLRIYGESH